MVKDKTLLDNILNLIFIDNFEVLKDFTLLNFKNDYIINKEIYSIEI